MTDYKISPCITHRKLEGINHVVSLAEIDNFLRHKVGLEDNEFEISLKNL